MKTGISHGWRWALLGLVIGSAVALTVYAPARWLAAALAGATGDRLQLVNARGTATATAFFPAAFLAEIARPTEFAPPYSAELTRGGESLTLRELTERTALDRRERLVVDLDFEGLALDAAIAESEG